MTRPVFIVLSLSINFKNENTSNIRSTSSASSFISLCLCTYVIKIYSFSPFPLLVLRVVRFLYFRLHFYGISPVAEPDNFRLFIQTRLIYPDRSVNYQIETVNQK